MLHTTLKQPVIVERDDHGLKVVLRDWGDKDHLEDRLTEDYGIEDLLFSTDGEGKNEVFTIHFPGREDQAALQKIVDEIA